MKTNRIRLSLIGLGVITAAAGVYIRLTQPPKSLPPPPPRPVRTLVVRSSEVADVLQQTGEIQPRTETTLSFQISGKVAARRVEVGQRINSGTVLAELDDTDVTNEMKSAEAELSAASSVENQAALANRRASGLLKISAVSRAEAEAAEASHKAATAKREAAQSLVAAARQKKAYARIVAEQDGVVTAVFVNAGQIVAPGQAVLALASLTERDAVFAIPETLIHLGSTNLQVEVSLATDPGIKTVGSVREVSPSADPGTRTFRVRVSLPAAPESMALGVSVVGKAVLPSRRTIQLPASSLTSMDGQPAVYVFRNETRTLERRSIQVGRFSNELVSVTAGLNDGDVVVTAGVSKLRPDQTVTLEETTR